MRSWLDTKTGEAAHQLYVADSYYGGPYRWDGAHGSDNKPLRFIAVGRNEIICEAGCSYFDEFAAALPEDLLKSHQNGLAVTFTANNNGKSLTIDVPGKVVAEELAAVDTVRAALPRADAAPPPPPAHPRDTSCRPPAAIIPPAR